MTRKIRIWYMEGEKLEYRDITARKLKEAYRAFQTAYPKAEITFAKIIG